MNIRQQKLKGENTEFKYGIFFNLLLVLYFFSIIFLHWSQISFAGYDSDSVAHLKMFLSGNSYSLCAILFGNVYKICSLFGEKIASLLKLSPERSAQILGGLGWSFIYSLFQVSIVYTLRFLMIELDKSIDTNTRYLFLSLLICIETAIWVPSLKYHYLGTFIAMPEHNLTYTTMAALALPSFTMFIRLWDNRSNKLCIPNYIIFIITLTLTTAVKPNFVFAFSIVVLGLLVYDFISTRAKNFTRELLIGISFFPGIVICIIQSAILFPNSESSGIVISPFKLLLYFSDESWILMTLNILRSIAFPLFVLLFIRSENKRKTPYIVSWIYFFVSLLECILFIEVGGRDYDGNFLWGVYFGVLLIFSASAVILAEQIYNKKTVTFKTAIGIVLFMLHVISGVSYFVNLLLGGSYK